MTEDYRTWLACADRKVAALQAERDEAVALLQTLMDVAAEAAGDRQSYDFKPRADGAAVKARLFLRGLAQ